MSTGNCKLDVTISSHHSDSNSVPKQVELFDSHFKKVQSKWFHQNAGEISNLKEGTYVLRVSLPSGKSMDEIVNIAPDKVNSALVELGSLSPRESHEWVYLNKSFSNQPGFKMPQLVPDVKIINIRSRSIVNGVWQPASFAKDNVEITDVGFNFEFTADDDCPILEFTGSKIPNLFVCVPPYTSLRCLVKLNPAEKQMVHPLDVTISTRNEEAEAILALLTSGDISRANTLWNAQTAEDLLYSKMSDPIAAVIGGYFLLNIGELDRLHNWTDNLANRFPQIPDGQIIHAWHLMKEGNQDVAVIKRIKERLISAVKAGLPIYTEGLRLLFDGLTMLSYHDVADEQVKKALRIIGLYFNSCDLSQETTTLTLDNLQSHDLSAAAIADAGLGNQPSSKQEKGNESSQQNLVPQY